jgi:predicted ATP-grasp superfamily ATP-dependent carboligase
MELAERAYGVNVFALHLAGCAGRLPGGHPAERQAAGFFGKAVVFARRAVVTPDTDAWLEESLGPGRAGPRGDDAGRAGAPESGSPGGPGSARGDDDDNGGAAWPAVRDVPGSGEHIAAGHPVCTVFAGGAPDRDACLADLHRAAATMYGRLQHGGRRREVRRERETHADQRSHA